MLSLYDILIDLGQFYCSKRLLLKEMGYFRESDELKRQCDAVHVGVEVHCDPVLFEWVINYIKRGTTEGPMGEQLTQPVEGPSLCKINNTI